MDQMGVSTISSTEMAFVETSGVFSFRNDDVIFFERRLEFNLKSQRFRLRGPLILQ